MTGGHKAGDWRTRGERLEDTVRAWRTRGERLEDTGRGTGGHRMSDVFEDVVWKVDSRPGHPRLVD